MSQDYRNLAVWEKARGFVKDVYVVTADLPKVETYGLQSRLRRAAVSIALNIAEGSGRDHRPDFARFLSIAVGSASEVECLTLIGQDLGYFSADQAGKLSESCREVRSMLTALRSCLLRPRTRQ